MDPPFDTLELSVELASQSIPARIVQFTYAASAYKPARLHSKTNVATNPGKCGLHSALGHGSYYLGMDTAYAQNESKH